MTENTLQNKAIKEVWELMLVGFRVLCPDDQYIIEIPKTSLPLNKRISEIKHVKNPLQQVGAFVVEHEFGEEDGYWVCVEVKEFEDIPHDMVTLTITPQRYATLTILK